MGDSFSIDVDMLVIARTTPGPATINQGIGSITNIPPEPPVTSDVPVTVREPRLTVLKTVDDPAGASVVKVGDELTYRLRVINYGDAPFAQTTLEDRYDDTELRFISASPAADDSLDDGVLNWSNLGMLPGNSSIVVVVTFEALVATDPEATINAVIAEATDTNNIPYGPETSEVPVTVVEREVVVVGDRVWDRCQWKWYSGCRRNGWAGKCARDPV